VRAINGALPQVARRHASRREGTQGARNTDVRPLRAPGPGHVLAHARPRAHEMRGELENASGFKEQDP
jgi:hypothetical protein